MSLTVVSGVGAPRCAKGEPGGITRELDSGTTVRVPAAGVGCGEAHPDGFPQYPSASEGHPYCDGETPQRIDKHPPTNGGELHAATEGDRTATKAHPYADGRISVERQTLNRTRKHGHPYACGDTPVRVRPSTPTATEGHLYEYGRSPRRVDGDTGTAMKGHPHASTQTPVCRRRVTRTDTDDHPYVDPDTLRGRKNPRTDTDGQSCSGGRPVVRQEVLFIPQPSSCPLRPAGDVGPYLFSLENPVTSPNG